MPDADRQMALSAYTVADLEKRWRIGGDKIRLFIRRGDLAAVNVATNAFGKPQWRIPPEAVEKFEAMRSSVPTPKPTKRKRTEGVDYYPD
jgi:hypothetical protein